MRNLFLIINIIPFILIHNTPTLSQWSDDPYINTRVSDWGVFPEAAIDGGGGSFISFQNFSYDSTFTFLQRINYNGTLGWSEPVRISNDPGNFQGTIGILNVGLKGALVGYMNSTVFYDSFFIEHQITEPYIQKFDSIGNKLFGLLGVKLRIDTTEFWASGYNITSDNNGGVFCFWDFSITGGGSYTDKLYIQHISKDGERLWGENGILVADSTFTPLRMKIIADDSGGIFLQYHQTQNAYYIENYDSTGTLKWTLKENLEYEKWIKDSEGGVILSAVKQEYPVNKLILNRISHFGEKLWGENGIVLDDSVFNIIPGPAELYLNSDSNLTVFWDNYGYPYSDIYAQRLNLLGENLWEENLLVTDAISPKGAIALLESEMQSNIFIWSDGREPLGLYAQRIDKMGNKIWGDSDRVITYLNHMTTQVVSDGNYGAIVVWETNPPWGGILAQQISKNGKLGEIVTSINDENYVPVIPKSYMLSQNYPNPFNPSTTINFSILERSFVTLKVYDILGREIANLVNEELKAGSFEKTFDASTLSSGVYIYRITAMKDGKILFNESKQMLMIK